MHPFVRQRTYRDGKLYKSTKPVETATARKWLDNVERDWLRSGLCPLTPAGQFDCNKAHTVTRISVDELIIVNTANVTLRFINVEAK